MVVLLVDDDPIVALAVACELEAAGHMVLGPAYDESSALDMAAAGHPDMALVDIDLGLGGDGVHLAWALMTAGVPAMFASGEGARAHANRGAVLGCLNKPYPPEAAVRSVEAAQALLQGRRADCPAQLDWFGRAPAPVAGGVLTH